LGSNPSINDCDFISNFSIKFTALTLSLLGYAHILLSRASPVACSRERINRTITILDEFVNSVISRAYGYLPAEISACKSPYKPEIMLVTNL
jgi:hypothetical protein